MAQKATIDGTAYEVSAGHAMIAGTTYPISGGKTMIAGTGYDISFGAKEYTLTVVGTGSSHRPYLEYKLPDVLNPVMIVGATTRRLPKGTLLKAVVAKLQAIYVNNVSKGHITSYEFTMTSDVTVEFNNRNIYITTT